MIYVIRHGETNLNKQGRLQGRWGLPLNEEGIKQAESLKDELKEVTFNYVISSPQERAVQTAEIATGLKAMTDERLDVFDLGQADRLKVEEVVMSGIVPDSNVYKGVENIQQYMKRVFAFMTELEDKYKNKDVNILLSGHKCTTGSVGAYFNGIPEDGDILKHSSKNGEYNIYEF